MARIRHLHPRATEEMPDAAEVQAIPVDEATAGAINEAAATADSAAPDAG